MAMANDPSAPEFWDIRFREGRMPWDVGGVPRELAKYLAGASGGGRVLIPGCGAAYEVASFHEAGYGKRGQVLQPHIVVMRDPIPYER